LKHFKALWSTTVSYTKSKRTWTASTVSEIDSEAMLERTNAWSLAVESVKKFSAIMKNKKPARHLKFLEAELDGVKEFVPVILSLRTRGLEQRHFVEMSARLANVIAGTGISLDPKRLTLADLKATGLTKGEGFDAIRVVADVAVKEGNVKAAVEAIDAEVASQTVTLAEHTGAYNKDACINVLRDAEAPV